MLPAFGRVKVPRRSFISSQIPAVETIDTRHIASFFFQRPYMACVPFNERGWQCSLYRFESKKKSDDTPPTLFGLNRLRKKIVAIACMSNIINWCQLTHQRSLGPQLTSIATCLCSADFRHVFFFELFPLESLEFALVTSPEKSSPLPILPVASSGVPKLHLNAPYLDAPTHNIKTSAFFFLPLFLLPFVLSSLSCDVVNFFDHHCTLRYKSNPPQAGWKISRLSAPLPTVPYI
jgi:hypothetical protein